MMSAAASLDLIAGALSLALLGCLLYRRLAASGYSLPAAIGLAMLALAQAGVALTGPNAWISLFFALVLYAIGASAAGLAQHQDARSVILMGGSLAGAQAIYPVGGFLTIVLVPALVGLTRVRGEPGRSGGLLALLLFSPCIAAVVLAYFANALNLDGARLLTALTPARSTLPAHSMGIATLKIACVLAVIAPAIGRILATRAARTGPGLAICAVAAALAASLVMTMSIGVVFETRKLLVVVTPLSVLAACAWPAGTWRVRAAFASGIFGALASWLAVWASLD